MTNLFFIMLIAFVALLPSIEIFSLPRLAPAEGPDAENVSGSDAQLFGRRWRLTEVESVAVGTTKPYIEFDRQAKRFTGDGGCNRRVPLRRGIVIGRNSHM